MVFMVNTNINTNINISTKFKLGIGLEGQGPINVKKIVDNIKYNNIIIKFSIYGFRFINILYNF